MSNIAICADDTTFYSNYHEASALRHQLELDSELEFEILQTGAGNGYFNVGKTQLVSFDRFNNSGAIDVKMDGSLHEEKSYCKMLELTFSS